MSFLLRKFVPYFSQIYVSISCHTEQFFARAIFSLCSTIITGTCLSAHGICWHLLGTEEGGGRVVLLTYPYNRVPSSVISLITINNGILLMVSAISSFFSNVKSFSTSVTLLKLELSLEKKRLIHFQSDLLL